MLVKVSLLIALLVTCAVLSVSTPRVDAFDSPLPTLEPPPFRPTPTGWPDAPFSWQTKPDKPQSSGIVTALEPVPTPMVLRVRVVKPRIVWPMWRWELLRD